MLDTGAAPRLRLFAGSVALACLASDAVVSDCGQEFRKLRTQLRERLETYANVEIHKDAENEADLAYRFPREWRPSGIDDDLDAGYWVFPEFLSPIVFKFHLPRKLQNNVLPGTEVGDGHSVEDFWIAYDGMIFVGVCPFPTDEVDFWLPAMVRKYLQTELLKSVGDFSAVVIPPSPMHVEIELLPDNPSTTGSSRKGVSWDSQRNLLVVRGYPTSQMTSNEIVENLYLRMSATLRHFYHLEIGRSIADDLLSDILSDAATAYQDYEASLDPPFWRVKSRWRIQRELSRKIGRIERLFSEHAFATTNVRKAQKRLYAELDSNPLMAKTKGYFRSATEPESLNYDLFRGSLEHIR